MVLGNGGVLSFHHDLDAGVAGFTESGEHVSVSLAIEGGHGPTLLARRAGVAGGGARARAGGTRSWVVDDGVPGKGKWVQIVVAVGLDSADDFLEGGGSVGRVAVSSQRAVSSAHSK